MIRIRNEIPCIHASTFCKYRQGRTTDENWGEGGKVGLRRCKFVGSPGGIFLRECCNTGLLKWHFQSTQSNLQMIYSNKLNSAIVCQIIVGGGVAPTPRPLPMVRPIGLYSRIDLYVNSCSKNSIMDDEYEGALFIYSLSRAILSFLRLSLSQSHTYRFVLEEEEVENLAQEYLSILPRTLSVLAILLNAGNQPAPPRQRTLLFPEFIDSQFEGRDIYNDLIRRPWLMFSLTGETVESFNQVVQAVGPNILHSSLLILLFRYSKDGWHKRPLCTRCSPCSTSY